MLSTSVSAAILFPSSCWKITISYLSHARPGSVRRWRLPTWSTVTVCREANRDFPTCRCDISHPQTNKFARNTAVQSHPLYYSTVARFLDTSVFFPHRLHYILSLLRSTWSVETHKRDNASIHVLIAKCVCCLFTPAHTMNADPTSTQLFLPGG